MAKHTFFKKKGLFCWLEPTCCLCKTLVSTAVLHRDHWLLPLQRNHPMQKGNCSSRRSPPSMGPSPETSANIYGDNTIQRGCISDRAGQPCRGGRGSRSDRFGCCSAEKARKEGKMEKLLSAPPCLPKCLHKLGVTLSRSVLWEQYHLG